MLGMLTSDFGYQNRLTLLQQLIECGDVLLGREFVYGMSLWESKSCTMSKTTVRECMVPNFYK